ncbi:hypothetical protein [Kribbella sp. NPDC048915]|uniref:hypothetical protein n=1 Tax=Kribbella sp. NPDC048915 TaxID=3155148 RepID=UPI00340400E8
MRAWVLVVVLAGLFVVGAAPPSVAAGNEVMRVSGAGGGTLGPEWKPFDGDPVRFEIEGTASDPLRPTGTFHVVHRKPDGRLLAEFRGRLTSLKVVDEVAVATGVIETAEHPELDLEMVGKPVSFTVYDDGAQDRIGWMWGFFNAPVEPLQGTAPGFALTEGGFQVEDGAAPARTAAAVDLTTAAERGTAVAAVIEGPREPVRVQLAGIVPPGGDPTQVRGRFRLAERTATVEGELTCLATGGPVAMATGVVTTSTDPARVGQPVSFAVKDGRTDRISWLTGWAAESIVDCRSVVPAHAPRYGGVVVRS